MENWQDIEEARKAAIKVLIHNSHGPYNGLPRTAGWGYPEPYTRDLMLSVIGIAVSESQELLNILKNILETVAANQTVKGHIPSLIHDKYDRGSSDSTPLFLMAIAIYRKLTGEKAFLNDAVLKSLTWMEYQSPTDRYLVGQLPTSDWRDEQWALGYGLYVNAVTYSYLKLFGINDRAASLKEEINRFIITDGYIPHHVYEGLAIKDKPYYAFWSYKIYNSDRFDLLGNSLAILSGVANSEKALKIISWIENSCAGLISRNELSLNIPPNFFPYMQPGDVDWIPRYFDYNMPGEYHNGGIWPFIASLYIAALVAAGEHNLARIKLFALTDLIKRAQDNKLKYGFNEWYKSQDGSARGQDWQTWSAALYLYAVKCVETNTTPFFDEMRA